MDTTFLILFIVFIVFVAFLLWLCHNLCPCQTEHQEPREHFSPDAEQGEVDWRRSEVKRAIETTGDVGFPNNRANTREVRNFILWENAKKKHIVTGPISVKSALKVSQQREEGVFSNTVFKAPSAFDKILISGQSECKVVSRERVRAIRCCKDETSGLWTGSEMYGRFYIIFDMCGHLMYKATMATRVSN